MPKITTVQEVGSLIERRIEITKAKSKKAQDAGDTASYYRHNTALHELWKLERLIEGRQELEQDWGGQNAERRARI